MTMLSSCKKSDPAQEDPDVAVAVRFSSNIGNTATLTKAFDSSWEASDAIGVFMTNNGAATVSNEATNKKYVTSSGDGNFAADGTVNDIYYPANGGKVDFIAYYPYQSSIATLGSYNVIVSNQSTPAAIDLLYAKATNSGNGYDKTHTSPIALNFAHKLSKLELSVSATTASGITSAELAAMTVKITGLKTTASFDLATGTLGAAATPADITLHTVTAGSLYDAILLPTGAFTDGELTVTFTITGGINDGTYTWNVPAGAFDPATQYNYAVAIGGGGVVTGVMTGGITSWEPGGSPTPGVIAHNAPAVNETLSANTAHVFEWTTLPNVTAYTIKFAGSANDLAATTMLAEVGNSNSFTLPAETLESFLATAGVPANGTAVPVYWTVVPTDPAQYSAVAVQVSMFNAIRQYIPPKSAWTLAWKSSEDSGNGYVATNAIDGWDNSNWMPIWGSPYIPCQILITFGTEILIRQITIVAEIESLRPTKIVFRKPDGAGDYESFLFRDCDGSGRDVFPVDPPVLTSELIVLVTESANADWTHIGEVYVE
jgi:hypothetical protein